MFLAQTHAQGLYTGFSSDEKSTVAMSYSVPVRSSASQAAFGVSYTASATMHNGTYRFPGKCRLVEHLGFPVQVSVDLPCHFRFFFVRNGAPATVTSSSFPVRHTSRCGAPPAVETICVSCSCCVRNDTTRPSICVFTVSCHTFHSAEETSALQRPPKQHRVRRCETAPFARPAKLLLFFGK